MRVPLQWLREYVDPALDTHALADRLTMTGTRSRRSTTTASARSRTSSSAAC